jgi:hypothetical protein
VYEYFGVAATHFVFMRKLKPLMLLNLGQKSVAQPAFERLQ